jgi:uncharacterized protein YbbK (DUF523 family)
MLKDKKVVISACLVGINCKYNNGNNYNEKVVNKLLNKELVLLVCPEIIFGVPRKKIWYQNGDGEDVINKRKNAKIINSDGKNVSLKLINSCKKICSVVKKYGIKEAILKERSPSCGVNFVYINNELTKGCGLLTAMLKKQKVKVISEEQI